MIFESRIFEVYFSTGERISHKSSKRFLLASLQSGMSVTLKLIVKNLRSMNGGVWYGAVREVLERLLGMLKMLNYTCFSHCTCHSYCGTRCIV